MHTLHLHTEPQRRQTSMVAPPNRAAGFEPVKWAQFIAIETYVKGQWRNLITLMDGEAAPSPPLL